MSAKGGTRTPIAFRLPDPKSGASANSATFARYGHVRLTQCNLLCHGVIRWPVPGDECARARAEPVRREAHAARPVVAYAQRCPVTRRVRCPASRAHRRSGAVLRQQPAAAIDRDDGGRRGASRRPRRAGAYSAAHTLTATSRPPATSPSSCGAGCDRVLERRPCSTVTSRTSGGFECLLATLPQRTSKAQRTRSCATSCRIGSRKRRFRARAGALPGLNPEFVLYARTRGRCDRSPRRPPQSESRRTPSLRVAFMSTMPVFIGTAAMGECC
jgi:hypothetical protein